jgi:hypothetical protein
MGKQRRPAEFLFGLTLAYSTAGGFVVADLWRTTNTVQVPMPAEHIAHLPDPADEPS